MSLTITAPKKIHNTRNVFPLTVSWSPDDTILDVKKKITSQAPKFYTSRQKLSIKGERSSLQDDTKLGSLAVGSELEVKDLGPQIGWRTVFLIEYAGPLVIHPLLYHFPQIFYGQAVQHSALQKLAYGVALGHFLKREYETVFVHRFSHGTMPFRNVFKNSFHYHILGGLFLAYDIYRPAFSKTSSYITNTFRDNNTVLNLVAALIAFFELSNYITHVNLRNLRPEGSTKRAIPYGYGFNLVSCPNYLFESLVWITLAGIIGSWAAWFFAIVGAGQMALWAQKKHRQYKKEFGKEYPRRKAMFPFIF